jgi:protein-S-isoprenylcysteine O-methyltransferase Ste14
MSIDRFFDWFGFAALVCLAFLAVPRALHLYARGIHVLVVDRQRTLRQILEDLIAMACLLLWFYELVACAWSVKFHFIPQRATIVVFDMPALKIVGALLLIAGLTFYGLGTGGLGESWRLGIDRKTPGSLRTNGIFAWTRNPIYLGFDLMVSGTFLIQGRLHLLLITIVLVTVLHQQIRREERFLAERYGDAFDSYCTRVGRYITWPPEHKRV